MTGQHRHRTLVADCLGGKAAVGGSGVLTIGPVVDLAAVGIGDLKVAVDNRYGESLGRFGEEGLVSAVYRWNFFPWDLDRGFNSGTISPASAWAACRSFVTPDNMGDALFELDEMRYLLADRIQCHMFDEGVLTAAQTLERIEAPANNWGSKDPKRSSQPPDPVPSPRCGLFGPIQGQPCRPPVPWYG